ncbi:MAG TPA: hypothetical protein VGD36_09310 [Xanthobacteraceae bacterium]|jgi:hypothetical protein
MHTITRTCLFVLLAAYPAAGLAQQSHHHPAEHAQLHENFYRKLQRPDVGRDLPGWQKSCCSDRDCSPTPARYKDGHWEFLKRGQWTSVPQSKIVDDRTPDMQAHACISVVTDELLCFVKPDFGI